MTIDKFYDLLASITDPDFCAKAYSDYLDDCANNFNKMVSAAMKALDDDYDLDAAASQYLIDQDLPNTDANYQQALEIIANDDTIIESRARAVLNEFGINPACSVTVYQGYTNALDLVKTLIKNSDDISLDETGETTLYSANLSITDINGDDVAAEPLISVIDDLKSSLHSVVCMSACAAASKYTSVSDRLQAFSTKIANTFSNVQQDISGSLQHYKAIITNVNNDVRSVCSMIMDELNVNDLIDDLSAKNTVDTTDICQYTGSSPLPALDFSSATAIAKTAIVGTAKVVAGAVASTVGTLWNKYVKPGIFKAVNKIKNVIDPYDIDVRDENAEGNTIDGWCWELHDSFYSITSQSRLDNLTSYFGLGTGWSYAHFISFMSGNFNHWIKMKLVTGEVLFRIKSITRDEYNKVKFNFDMKFKPCLFDAAALARVIMNAGSSGKKFSGQTSSSSGYDADYITLGYDNTKTDNFDDILVAVKKFIAEGGYNAEVTETNELEVYSCFKDSYLMTYFIVLATYDMIAGAVGLPTFGSAISCTFLDSWDGTSITNPTNKEFIQILSGWNGDTSSPAFDGVVSVKGGCGSDLQPLQYIGFYLVAIYVIQQLYRYAYPTNYVFMPYRNNLDTFDDAKYRVKTDAENQEALTSFLTNVVIITIAVAVTIAIGVTAIKVAKRKFWKRTEFLGKSDNLMWNGGKLSKRDKRKYLRYQRKLGVSSTANSGLAGGFNSLVNSASEAMTASRPDDMAQIATLLVGTN